MLTFTEAQVTAWITPLLWPLLRVLALFGAMPLIAQRSVPVRLRVALAFLIALAAQAALPAMPDVALDSARRMRGRSSPNRPSPPTCSNRRRFTGCETRPANAFMGWRWRIDMPGSWRNGKQGKVCGGSAGETSCCC